MTATWAGIGAAAVLAAGYAVGGEAGLFAAVALTAIAALLAARLRIPPAAPRLPRHRRAQHTNQAFPAYRRVETALSEARVSRRQFDHAARPLLQRLMVALLDGRRRVDAATSPEAARAAVGEDVWPLLDPSRPASEDMRQPGVTASALAKIVDRLEDL